MNTLEASFLAAAKGFCGLVHWPSASQRVLLRDRGHPAVGYLLCLFASLPVDVCVSGCEMSASEEEGRV